MLSAAQRAQVDRALALVEALEHEGEEPLAPGGVPGSVDWAGVDWDAFPSLS